MITIALFCYINHFDGDVNSTKAAEAPILTPFLLPALPEWHQTREQYCEGHN